MKQEILQQRMENLLEESEQFFEQVLEAMQEITGKRVVFYAQPQDKIRLLVVKSLSLRHRLSIEETLRLLRGAPHLRMFRVHPLGGPVSVLTGPKSLQYFEEQIMLRFGNGENIQAWRSKEQLVHIAHTFEEENLTTGLEGAAASYIRRVRRASHHLKSAAKLFNLPSRDNPFQ